MELSERDRAILDFERSWWTGEGSKAAAVQARFAFSPTKYYRLLNELCARPEAEGYDPLVVRRVRRSQDRRRRVRYEGPRADGRPQR